MGAYAQIDTNPNFRFEALLGGIVVLLLSSWFSFSSLVFLNFNAQLQRVMNDAQQVSLIAPVRALERSMARIEQETSALSAVATRRSNTEALSGGQCVANTNKEWLPFFFYPRDQALSCLLDLVVRKRVVFVIPETVRIWEGWCERRVMRLRQKTLTNGAGLAQTDLAVS